MLSLFGVLCLFAAGSVQATAPRIAAQMFGVESKADIAAYPFVQITDSSSKAEEELLLELVRAAYKAAGQEVVIDVMPSRQLAQYALQNGDVAALLGTNQDSAAKTHAIVFFIRENNEQPVSLIFNIKSEQANKRYKAFANGLNKIISDGQYAHIFSLYCGKDATAAEMIKHIKSLNQKVK